VKLGAFRSIFIWVFNHLDKVLNLGLNFIDALNVVQSLVNVLGCFHLEFELLTAHSILGVVKQSKVIDSAQTNTKHKGPSKETIGQRREKLSPVDTLTGTSQC